MYGFSKIIKVYKVEQEYVTLGRALVNWGKCSHPLQCAFLPSYVSKSSSGGLLNEKSARHWSTQNTFNEETNGGSLTVTPRKCVVCIPSRFRESIFRVHHGPCSHRRLRWQIVFLLLWLYWDPPHPWSVKPALTGPTWCLFQCFPS